MNPYRRYTICLILLLLLVTAGGGVYGQSGPDTLVVHLSADRLGTDGDGALVQHIDYEVPAGIKNAKIIIASRQLRAKDTLTLYEAIFEHQTLEAGAHTLTLALRHAAHLTGDHPGFLTAVERFGALPAGQYITTIDITSVSDSSIIFHKDWHQQADSTLSAGSSLRKDLNGLFSDARLPANASSVKTSKLKDQTSTTREALQHSAGRISRRMKGSGISTRPVIKDGKTYTELYYEDWFLGRYELVAGKAMEDNIEKEGNALKDNATSLVTNNLEDFNGVHNELQSLFAKRKQEETALQGNFDINQVMGSGQEAGSAQENNYTEFRGTIDTKVWDMPVGIDGFYTTQDQHRQARASYIRVHYDVEAAKEELGKKISSYKNKYNETVAKGKGLEMIYTGYLDKVKNEKSSLLQGLSKEYGVSENTLKQNNGDLSKVLDTKGLIDTTKIINTAVSTAEKQAGKDSTASATQDKLSKAKEKIARDQAEIKKRYERLLALEQQYEKYHTLLTQYKEQLHLDSAISYSSLQKLQSGKDVSYKDMLKAASGIMPEGKVKQFTSGLTHFDAGILNQYESDYTMAGQNLKGLSSGYDFGFVKAGVTVGKTQYVSRDGSVDNYNSYLGKLSFKPIGKQQLELLYYGYNPALKSQQKDSFYSHTDIAPDGYKEPVHVVSLNYNGGIGSDLQLHSEGAVSMRKGDAVAADMDHSAVKTAAEYNVTKLQTQLQGEWEHVGRSFENSTLPFTMAGTDRYTLAGTTDLLHSFLTLGLQFNYLEQNSLSSSAHSIKWGFDIKTHSKRYPSVQLSYKPFSTFRSYTDTFNVPQRPMTGEVWTGRASYQLKKHKLVHRFTLVYNQNSSNTDTVSYHTRMVQAGYMLSSKGDAYSINTGWNSVPLATMTDSTGAVVSSSTKNTDTWFANISITRTLSKRVSINVGQDVAIAAFGLQRAATTGGVQYRLKQWPVSIRLQARYTNYRLAENTTRTNIYGGQAGVNWQFKMKRRS
ncbi:hypothetical protein ACTHGU_03675 [Chitinophagaceae bacterium MMS25-I14]